MWRQCAGPKELGGGGGGGTIIGEMAPQKDCGGDGGTIARVLWQCVSGGGTSSLTCDGEAEVSGARGGAGRG